MFSFLKSMKMTNKILTVKHTDHIWDVLEMMERHKIGAVLVLKDGKLDGIFTERDLLMQWRNLSNMAIKEIAIEKIMTKNVKSLSAGKLEKAAVTMLAKKFRHLPILDGDKIVNFLSIRDVLEMALQENDALREELEKLKKGKK